MTRQTDVGTPVYRQVKWKVKSGRERLGNIRLPFGGLSNLSAKGRRQGSRVNS